MRGGFFRYCLAFAVCALVSHPSFATDWYVDGLNGVDGPNANLTATPPNYGNCSAAGNTRGTMTAPFFNFWCGLKHAMPGDTVHLLPTVVYLGISDTSYSGTAGAPITIMGDGVAPNMTKITNNPAATSGASIDKTIYLGDVSYVNIVNLDSSGDTQVSSACVFIHHSSHIGIYNSVLHGCGGEGIQTANSDWLTFSGNQIYDNSYNTNNGAFGSGISILRSVDTDSNTSDYKMNIVNNVIYHNSNTPRTPNSCGGSNNPNCKCTSDSCAAYYTDSDGSGIIFDRNNGSVPATLSGTAAPVPPYNGKSLVANNIIFDNGGRGLHIYLSDHITVTNNTIFYNNQDPYEGSFHPGEINVVGGGPGVVGGGDVSIYNNILYSDGLNTTNPVRGNKTGTHTGISVSSVTDGLGPVYADYNLIYNPQNNAGYMYYQAANANPVTFDLHNLFEDPLFVDMSTDPSVENVRTQAGSPAIGSGYAPMAPATDIAGMPRLANGPVDMGAFQSPATNGVVGSDSGQSFASLSPSDPNLCSAGTVINFIAYSNGWTWACAGTNGGKTDISGAAYKIMDAMVGSDNGNNFATLTAADPNLCAVGAVSGFTSTATGWSWTCLGVNGGKNANGTAGQMLDAVPGKDNGGNFSILTATAPHLCAVGAVSNFTVTATGWTWTCLGVNGGKSVSCSGTKIVDANVGSDNGGSFYTLSAADTNLCSAGNASGFTATPTGWTWTCLSTNGGKSASGSANKSVDAQTGSDNGGSFYTLSPTDANLCSTGTVSGFAGTTNGWTWTCLGANNGKSVSGAASKSIDAQTGSDNGGSFYTLSATDINLCSAGNVSGFTATPTGWTWTCLGASNGKSASGAASKSVDGVVGKDGNGNFTILKVTAPHLCAVGAVSNFTVTATGWTWTCLGVNGGQDAAGIGNKIVDAQTGSDNGGSFYTLPPTDANLCSAGTVSGFAGTANGWTWSCLGVNGGKSVSGAAIKSVDGVVGKDGDANFTILKVTAPHLCATGAVSNFTVTPTGWTWTCLGVNGGKDAAGVGSKIVEDYR